MKRREAEAVPRASRPPLPLTSVPGIRWVSRLQAVCRAWLLPVRGSGRGRVTEDERVGTDSERAFPVPDSAKPSPDVYTQSHDELGLTRLVSNRLIPACSRLTLATIYCFFEVLRGHMRTLCNYWAPDMEIAWCAWFGIVRLCKVSVTTRDFVSILYTGNARSSHALPTYTFSHLVLGLKRYVVP